MRIYFPRLIGNEETKERLGRAIESGTLPHAFLIGGPSGSGKSTLAIEIAAALNCSQRHNSQTLPCGKCNNCHRIYEGNFPDVNSVTVVAFATGESLAVMPLGAVQRRRDFDSKG